MDSLIRLGRWVDDKTYQVCNNRTIKYDRAINLEFIFL